MEIAPLIQTSNEKRADQMTEQPENERPDHVADSDSVTPATPVETPGVGKTTSPEQSETTAGDRVSETTGETPTIDVATTEDAATDDGENTVGIAVRTRRIDYPRAEKSGLRRWIPSWRLVLGTAVASVVAGFAALAAAVVLAPMPQPHQVVNDQATTFYWNDGTTVLGRTGQANRKIIDLSQVPEPVQHAVLAAEDRSFYSHTGFDVVGIARALRNNVSGSATGLQGGSTITQQYAKNAYLSQDQTLVRKASELVVALKLELTSSKDDILQDYLNTVYYGRGAYGVEAAAKEYFGVPAQQLTVEQGAVLAALIAAPNGLSPEENLPGLQERWNYVLDGLVAEGQLDAQERAAAQFPVISAYRPLTTYYEGPNGFLLAAAQQQFLELGYSEEELNSGGMSVITSFDQAKQMAAVAAVNEYAPSYNADGVRIGMAAVETGTGGVVSLYGGADYAADKYNNATQARGQAGSTFKAFGLTAGLANGLDLNTSYSGASPLRVYDYEVRNYGNADYGNVTMLNSTVNSINTPFVAMNADIGGEKTREAIVAAGIPADTPGLGDELNNVLGSASPTPLEQARAFATFATRGQRIDTTMIYRVLDAESEVVYEWQPHMERALDESLVDQVTYALRQVVSSGTATGALSAGRPVAGKTGTSDDFKSAWFAGYTPQLAAAVMMVRNDADGNSITLSGVGGLTEVTGGSMPARIFGKFVSIGMQDIPVVQFQEPRSVPRTTVTTPRDQQLRAVAPRPVPSSPTPTPTQTVEPTPTPPVTPTPVAPPPPVYSPPAPTPPPAAPSAPATPGPPTTPSVVSTPATSSSASPSAPATP
jgi:membrane peptidoglycan carboxypeptidase